MPSFLLSYKSMFDYDYYRCNKEYFRALKYESQTIAMKSYGIQMICLLCLMVATVASVNLGLCNLSEAAVVFNFVRYSISHRKESGVDTRQVVVSFSIGRGS